MRCERFAFCTGSSELTNDDNKSVLMLREYTLKRTVERGAPQQQQKDVLAEKITAADATVGSEPGSLLK